MNDTNYLTKICERCGQVHPRFQVCGCKLLWHGKVDLHNGMLCGYQGDPKERIQAPDQIVMVYVVGKKTGGKGERED